MSFLIPVHLLNQTFRLRRPYCLLYPWKTSTVCIENLMNIYKYMYACHKIMPVICVSDKNVGFFCNWSHSCMYSTCAIFTTITTSLFILFSFTGSAIYSWNNLSYRFLRLKFHRFKILKLRRIFLSLIYYF